MNVINERIRVLTARDPTLVGLTGRVLLDTANTFLLESTGKTTRIAKSGMAFQVLSSGRVLTGADVAGKLEERLGRRRR